ncbi:Deuterolysin metalloprotease family-domain-containing protein [Pterulicium gracile]|uniref:deuterolysin n=1 Tax=Pterulicium gracile TaxID=1884261 RepID=A0A5C3Q4L4_9AGAR|nr:Deuterolysin metalloprotease family-domain-containing protein [Pterula gracilis]
MLFSLATLALVAGALATPVKRASGLVVSVTASNVNVASIADVAITAKIENTGAEDLRILNFATIFDAQRPTRSFTVIKEGEGEEHVKFIGVSLNVDLTQVDESAFTVIPAGESITVEHTNLADLYDFEAAGTGAYTFEPVTIFQIEDGNSLAPVDNLVTLESTSNTVTIDITSDVKRREVANEKRATISCTNTSQRAQIQSSYTEAKSLATISANWISSNSGNALYSAYFGTNSATTVRSRFTAIANENSSTRTLNCSDPYGVCTGGVIAYMLIATTNIYFCSIFYNHLPHPRLCSGTTVAQRNLRGGTTLHELSHAVASTTDVTYGCAANQALSVANKLRNADNYNCFAAQVYQNTQC